MLHKDAMVEAAGRVTTGPVLHVHEPSLPAPDRQHGENDFCKFDAWASLSSKSAGYLFEMLCLCLP